MLTKAAENTFSVRWVGGWVDYLGLKVISTQVVVEVEVGVELGNNLSSVYFLVTLKVF